MIVIASAVLMEDVPPRDRVEVIAPGVLAPLFPMETVRVRVDGATIPKSHVEVSPKHGAGGILTIVNKTVRVWPDHALLEAYTP